MSLVHHRRARLFGAAAALVVALTMPGLVSADTGGGGGGPGGVTVTVGSTARLTGRVAVTAHVLFVCQPLQAYDWNTGQIVPTTDGVIESLEVTVAQASGRSIATASGGIGWGSHATCNGTTVNAFDVSALSSTVPFRNGSAVATATVWVIDANMSAGENGSSGPVVVKLSSK